MTTTAAITPKVFISYSYDSQAHKGAVWQLACGLRDNDIDGTIDRNYSGIPGKRCAVRTLLQEANVRHSRASGNP